MRLVAQRVDAGGVDPAVVEVEERADGQRVVGGLVRPPGVVQGLNIGGSD